LPLPGHQQVPEDKRNYIDLAWLVSFLIVKLRLIAAFDKKQRCSEETGISDEEASRVEHNRNMQIPVPLDAIDKRNKSMLPSFINTLPLISQPLIPFQMDGAPCEAAGVLRQAIGPFYRCPGAAERLIQRVGRNPTYDSNMNAHGLWREDLFTNNGV